MTNQPQEEAIPFVEKSPTMFDSSSSSLSLEPDHIDDPNPNHYDDIILPSFHDLKRKTLQSLYGIDIAKGKGKGKHDGNSGGEGGGGVYKNYTYNHTLLKDKSPKGSVDESIRSLVDLINSHPSYATLSSCSGRIALFNPNSRDVPNTSTTIDDGENNDREPIDTQGQTKPQSDDANDNNDNVTKSGKGHGAWLIASHGQITLSELESALDDHCHVFQPKNEQATTGIGITTSTSNTSKSLIFKHEPLLLHIAASTLRRARQILTIALNLGFRESGTIQTSKRITVAIRSHSLSLTVPLQSWGALRPSREYMDELVREANERFVLNEEKLKALEKEIELNLFQKMEVGGRGVSNHCPNSIQLHHKGLPALNLWGHAAVSIPRVKDGTNSSGGSGADAEIFVFGGYGSGPIDSSSSNSKSKSKSCSRSNKVFHLQRQHGEWDDEWTEMTQRIINEDESKIQTLKIAGGNSSGSSFEMEQVPFTARESLDACVLPICIDLDDQIPNASSPIIALFGGRASPAKPSNDLLLFPFHHPTEQQQQQQQQQQQGPASFFKPIDIRGQSPSPRWGHSFVPLSGHNNNGRLAVVIGGRDEHGITPSIHILSLVSTEQSSPSSSSSSTTTTMNHFIWETLSESIPRFHHSSVKVPTPSSSTDSDTIFVFGGLDCSDSLLGLSNPSSEGKNYLSSYSLEINTTPSSKTVTVTEWKKDEVPNSLSIFGASSCSFLQKNLCTFPLLLTTGGLLSYENSNDNNNNNNNETSLNCQIVISSTNPPSFVPCKIQYHNSHNGGTSSNDDDDKDSHILNLGSLVHHVALDLPPSSSSSSSSPPPPRMDGKTLDNKLEIVLIGGGIPSFSFGQSFARSYVLQIMTSNDNEEFSTNSRNVILPNNKKRVEQQTTHIPNNTQQQKQPQPQQKQPNDKTNVLYVEKRKAKKLKIILESNNFLDKRYRMTKASNNDFASLDGGGGGGGGSNPTDYIAVPITDDCVNSILNKEKGIETWFDLVTSRGIQIVPFSTAVMGRK